MRNYRHAAERRAAKTASSAYWAELEADRLEEEAIMERHEDECAAWRGYRDRAYEWALPARQLRHEVWLAWSRAVRTARSWEELCREAQWCLARLEQAEKLEEAAEKAALEWYREALED